MRSKWEVQLLTTVVAVCAVLYGNVAPVRAAQVTYNIENAELANGWAVTGSIDFDNVEGQLVGGSVNVNEGGGDEEVFDMLSYGFAYAVALSNQSETQIMVIDTGIGDDIVSLTGSPGEEEPINTEHSSVIVGTTGDQYAFDSGYVTDGPSVPEPSSIMATVTAVTLGVGLRRMKRKV